MLHPRFVDFVEETKAAGITPVDLTTNAMSLDEEKMRRLLSAPIDVIDVSLDAFSKETYEKIRDMILDSNMDLTAALAEKG